MRMEWSDQLIEDFLSVEGLEMTEMGRSVVMNCLGVWVKVCGRIRFLVVVDEVWVEH